MDYGDYYCGFYRDYYRDPFPHSLLSTRQCLRGAFMNAPQSKAKRTRKFDEVPLRSALPPPLYQLTRIASTQYTVKQWKTQGCGLEGSAMRRCNGAFYRLATGR